MTGSSLRLRLLIAWAVFILLALQLAAVGLRVLFERSITRRTISELEFDLRQLTRGLTLRDDGEIDQKRRPTDPQFEVPNGGRYWQVSDRDTILLRSVSLGSSRLDIENAPPIGTAEVMSHLNAPDGKPLFSLTRQWPLPNSETGIPRIVTIVSAVNASEIREDTDKFSSDLLLGLSGLAALLLAGAWLHVTIGLLPLKRVRASLASIRTGGNRRIDGSFPSELMPLIDETNALLDAQQGAIEAARARAGDLAHGLKTPLAIMAAKSRSLRQAGTTGVADDIDRQIETMRRHVQRELARARARGKLVGGAMNLDLSSTTRELVSAIQTLPRARTLEWTLDLDPELGFPVDRADYNDILGNLVDNAQKWAKSQIEVRLKCLGIAASIIVEDDGPGVEASLMDQISKRGVKGNATEDGSGLGLAIVGDIVELYGGTLKLERSYLGGLKASVELPGQTHRIVPVANKVGEDSRRTRSK